MPETFHSFTAAAAEQSTAVLSHEFTWGGQPFAGVLGEASMEDGEAEAIGEATASIIKARKGAFTGPLPSVGDAITAAGVSYRVAAPVVERRSDPFITIPVIQS